MIKAVAKMDFKVQFELSEDEVRLLQDIAGYGWPEFLKVFKEHMGKAYIEEHEHVGKALFDKLYQEIPNALGKIQAAKDAFYK